MPRPYAVVHLTLLLDRALWQVARAGTDADAPLILGYFDRPTDAQNQLWSMADTARRGRDAAVVAADPPLIVTGDGLLIVVEPATETRGVTVEITAVVPTGDAPTISAVEQLGRAAIDPFIRAHVAMVTAPTSPTSPPSHLRVVRATDQEE